MTEASDAKQNYSRTNDLNLNRSDKRTGALVIRPWALDISRTMPPSIEFSVVSGSNEDMIVECLDSLYASIAEMQYPAAVTATCNSPGTGLAARLRDRFPGIRTIDNPISRGFAANHNTVLADSNATYVWLLNDDLVMLSGTVQRVTDFMEAF